MTGKAVWWFEKFGIVPKGTWDVQETLKIAADALVVSTVPAVDPLETTY